MLEGGGGGKANYTPPLHPPILYSGSVFTSAIIKCKFAIALLLKFRRYFWWHRQVFNGAREAAENCCFPIPNHCPRNRNG